MKHGTHLDKNKKSSVSKANLVYTLGVPIVFFGILIIIVLTIKSQITKFYDNSIKSFLTSTPKNSVEEIKKQDDGTRSIEDIINSSIDDVLEKEDLTIKTDYSNMTLDEILKGNSKTADDYLAEELGIKYVTGSYEGITKDGALVLTIDGEKKYIYLIGVSNLNTNFMGAYLSDFDTLYVEYDISKKQGSGEQAYVWTAEPNNDQKDKMLNVIAITSGWGTYVDPSPNIKYTYYFLKIKP